MLSKTNKQTKKNEKAQINNFSVVGIMNPDCLWDKGG